MLFLYICRASHLGLLYLGSLVVLLAYSVLYGLTARESRWLGGITSAAVIVLGTKINFIFIYLEQEQTIGLFLNSSSYLYFHVDWNIGACLYGFKLLQNRVLALFVAGTSRLFLICFGIHYWFISELKACYLVMDLKFVPFMAWNLYLFSVASGT